MCGISGIAGVNWESAQLHRMVSSLKHRGPDDEGIYTNPNHTVGLGHNRLSIIDLSTEAKCPMFDTSGDISLVFNGEIYNYIELKNLLHEYKFRTSSDTEIILAAYKKWGPDCVTRFIGMFSYAIWDETTQTLICTRDRLGIKPLYYHINEYQITFSSEIKAILSSGVDAKPNWNQWSDYLRFGLSDNSDNTFFDGIFSVPPGHNLIYQNGKISTHRYWNLPLISSEISNSSENECINELTELLTSAIQLHSRSDVPIGLNLSSGLDSTLLAHLLNSEFKTSKLHAFTSSFREQEFDEYRHIDHSRLENLIPIKNITHSEAIPSLAKKLTWNQEAPFGGIPTLAYYDLHSRIKELGIKVSLEAQGLDELFGGYAYVRPYYYADIAVEKGWSYLEKNHPESKEHSNLIRNILDGSDKFTSTDGTTAINTSLLNPEHSLQTYSPPMFNKPYTDHFRNVLYKDLFHTKLPRVLRMNDRLSMANGIELRVPFLDHRLIEYAFTVPNQFKISNNTGKLIVRHLLHAKFPHNDIQQAKKSIVTPQTLWLQTDLSTWVEEIIHSSSFTNRGIFDIPKVHQAFKHFKNNSATNSFFIWQWVNTELWFRTFIDQNIFGTAR
ncbi:MAG: asparagine synthase (glutamine-hydrolyzing) [SAR202 cluster bacterium]|nr:asparagine synthase (glutamine-hydrolyzing) [SAR202 cluster bacterium]